MEGLANYNSDEEDDVKNEEECGEASGKGDAASTAAEADTRQNGSGNSAEAKHVHTLTDEDSELDSGADSDDQEEGYSAGRTGRKAQKSKSSLPTAQELLGKSLKASFLSAPREDKFTVIPTVSKAPTSRSAREVMSAPVRSTGNEERTDVMREKRQRAVQSKPPGPMIGKQVLKEDAKEKVKRQRLRGQSGVGSDFRTWRTDEEMRLRQHYD